MMHYTLQSFVSTALPSLFLFFVACGSGSEQTPNTTSTIPASEAGDPAYGDWVVIHSLSDPESINPVTSSDATAQEIDSYIYEALTTTDVETLQTIPWIADSHALVSDDRLSYEFTIRKDARFSDGKPVTGEDFIFYLKTIKNPRILKAAPLRGYYTRVDSATLIDGDPHRLRVVMASPYYLGEQWAGGLYAYPKHIWDPEGISDKVFFTELNAGDTNHNPLVKQFAENIEDIQRDFDPAFLVGSGPYIMDEYREQDRVVLRWNPDYWNSKHRYGANYPARIVWLTINDLNAALSALKAGEIDFVPRLDQVQYKYEKVRFTKNDLVPNEYDYPAYNYVGYNADREEKPFLADKRVRWAFAHALDRRKMIEKIFFGNAQPVQSPIYRKRPEYDTALPFIEYDLDKARSLLDEAEWKDSDGDGVRDKVIDGKKVEMEFNLMLNSGNNNRRQMAIIFAEALKKIGVIANPSTIEWAVFLERLDKHDFDACIGGWVSNVTEGDMYQLWHSESSVVGGSNYVSFKNPRVDELIERIRGEFDFKKRRGMYQEIQQIIYDEQPYNFLVAEKRVCGYNDRFHDVGFFAPRPCYNAGWWWAPKNEQRYSTPSARQAVAID